MKQAIAAVLGLLVSFVFQPSLLLIVAFGVVAGCAVAFADAVFPRAQPTYVPPVSRPLPVTARGQATGVIICIVIGLLAIAFALWIALPRLWWRLYLFYIGAMSVGMALAQLLTAAKVRERHNNWLAAMTPVKPLDSEL